MTSTPTSQNSSPGTSKKRNWSRIIVALFCVAIFAWLLASWGVAYTLTHRAHAPFSEPVPQVTWANFEPCPLQTADGLQLGAWFSLGQPTRPIVLLLHGNSGSRKSCLPQAELLAREGYGLLMISLRAHGDSTGSRVDFGPGVAQDLLAALHWLEQKHPERNLIVWGQSLGSSAALHAAEKLPARVTGCILECPFQNLARAVQHRTDFYLPVPLNWIAYAGLRLMAPLVLADIDRISPADQAAKMPRHLPVCILVGGKDRRAPLADAQAIAGNLKSPVEIVLFQQGDHLDLLTSDPRKYRETILGFIDRIRQGKR